MHEILLALLIFDRKSGDPAEYREQAIYHYKQALEVFTPNEFPEEWARVQEALVQGQTRLQEVW